MNNDLDAAVAQLLSSAQAAFTVSDDPADIRQNATALRALLQEWQAHGRRVDSTVIGLLRLVQSRCKHVGAARGHNERDGSWMVPCPTCGASE